MVAVVIAQAVALVLLIVLVAGLLRSHAEILRALHQLGVGFDEVTGAPTGVSSGVRLGATRRDGTFAAAPANSRTGGPAASPFELGDSPWVPTAGGGTTGNTGTAAGDVSGVTPFGDAVHIAVSATPRRTLLAFLTSGCATCANFWDAMARPDGLELPTYVDRLVVVTRGADRESPALIAARTPQGRTDVVVVMSTDAWTDYEVPVSPYFVLVEGSSGRIVGEGAAGSWPQLTSLLERAAADSLPPPS